MAILNDRAQYLRIFKFLRNTKIYKKGASDMRKLSGIQSIQSVYANSPDLAAMSGLLMLPQKLHYPIQPPSLHIIT